MRKFEVSGKSYEFEAGKHPAGADILIAYWNKNGESFGIYSIEASMPESTEEAADILENLDWSVKDF